MTMRVGRLRDYSHYSGKSDEQIADESIRMRVGLSGMFTNNDDKVYLYRPNDLIRELIDAGLKPSAAQRAYEKLEREGTIVLGDDGRLRLTPRKS